MAELIAALALFLGGLFGIGAEQVVLPASPSPACSVIGTAGCDLPVFTAPTPTPGPIIHCILAPCRPDFCPPPCPK